MIPSRQAGLTLLELLIALGISVAIVGTIAQALALTSEGYQRTETLAEMQEQADVAFRFLADDLRMAGHWGLAHSARHVGGRSLPGQSNPRSLAVPSRCAPEFVLDLSVAIAPTDDPDSWGCNLTAASDSHAVVLRQLAGNEAAPIANRLQVVTAPGHGLLTDQGEHESMTAQPTQRHNLNVFGYYISQRSGLFPDQPVLRRLTLTAFTNRPILIDEEVAHGIEDMHLVALVDRDADGHADQNIAIDDPLLKLRDGDGFPLHRIVALRVTLLIRSRTDQWDATPPTLFIDEDQIEPPDDGRLRFVVTRTIRIRNPGVTS